MRSALHEIQEQRRAEREQSDDATVLSVPGPAHRQPRQAPPASERARGDRLKNGAGKSRRGQPVVKPRTARDDEIPEPGIPVGADTDELNADVDQLSTASAVRRDEDLAPETVVNGRAAARIQRIFGAGHPWRWGAIVGVGLLLLLAILAALLRP